MKFSIYISSDKCGTSSLVHTVSSQEEAHFWQGLALNCALADNDANVFVWIVKN